MEVAGFFYRIYLIDNSQKPVKFLGSAFPIVPNGGLITCRHVVDIVSDANFRLAVYDNEFRRFSIIHKVIFPSNQNLDLAFLPNALDRVKEEYIPILEPSKVLIGEEVYSFGYYAIGGRVEDVTQGYFSGRIVNIFQNQMRGGCPSLTLPYPILEGMSGSPAMTYHNGPKLVGVCYGNQAQRVIASEVVEYQDTKKEYKETVSRIIELGLAHHPFSLSSFLNEMAISGFVVSEEKISLKGLE